MNEQIITLIKTYITNSLPSGSTYVLSDKRPKDKNNNDFLILLNIGTESVSNLSFTKILVQKEISLFIEHDLDRFDANTLSNIADSFSTRLKNDYTLGMNIYNILFPISAAYSNIEDSGYKNVLISVPVQYIVE